MTYLQLNALTRESTYLFGFFLSDSISRSKYCVMLHCHNYADCSSVPRPVLVRAPCLSCLLQGSPGWSFAGCAHCKVEGGEKGGWRAGTAATKSGKTGEVLWLTVVWPAARWGCSPRRLLLSTEGVPHRLGSDCVTPLPWRMLSHLGGDE